MSAVALPRVPMKKSYAYARPKSDRWSEGDARVVVPGLGELIAHGLDHKMREHLSGFRGKLRGWSKDDLYSQATEQGVLTAITGGTAFGAGTAIFIGLTTVAVANTDTSASVTEATGATGYARKTSAGSWGAASGGNPASIVNSAGAITFNAITAGTATVIGYFGSPISTTGGAGAIYFYGTCTSVVISATQTPPTIAANGLTVTQT